MGAQLPFAWVGNVLRDAEPDVGEIAVTVARERAWASYAELLYRELRVGKGRSLLGNISRCLPSVERGRNLRVLLLCLLYQFMQRRWRGSVLRHGERFRNPRLRPRWFLSSNVAGECKSSNEQTRRNERNTSAPEETSGQLSALPLSSRPQTNICKRTNVRTHECVSSSEEDDQILKTVLVRDSNPGGLCV